MRIRRVLIIVGLLLPIATFAQLSTLERAVQTRSETEKRETEKQEPEKGELILKEYDDKRPFLIDDRTESERMGYPYSLAQCLAIGLEQNYDIRIIKNAEKKSDNNATRGAAGALPTVSLAGGYSGTLNNTKQELIGGESSSNNGIHNHGVNAGVNLGWTLFDGFSIRTNYQRLQEFQKMGELNTRLAIDGFIARFADEYYRFIRQNIRLKNLQYAVSLSQERLRIVESHYEIGSKSRLDLQQAMVDLNSDRSQLLKQHETMHIMRTRLNQMLAMENIESPIELADTTIIFDHSLKRDEIEQQMMAQNRQLSLARRESEVSKLDYKEVRSGRYPYMKVNGGYGYSRNWYGSGSVDRQRQLSLNYGVSLGVNLFDGMNQKRRERNARIDIENSTLSYKQMELSVLKELSDQWMSYRNNINLTSLERDNLTTARANYAIAMERYRLGQLSGIELREAQTSLLDAEERLIQAEYDTKLCEIEQLYLSGGALSYMR